jgi:hypothetical protein
MIVEERLRCKIVVKLSSKFLLVLLSDGNLVSYMEFLQHCELSRLVFSWLSSKNVLSSGWLVALFLSERSKLFSYFHVV